MLRKAKNSWKFVYILPKQCRSPFNLTIFFSDKSDWKDQITTIFIECQQQNYNIFLFSLLSFFAKFKHYIAVVVAAFELVHSLERFWVQEIWVLGYCLDQWGPSPCPSRFFCKDVFREFCMLAGLRSKEWRTRKWVDTHSKSKKKMAFRLVQLNDLERKEHTKNHRNFFPID